MAPSIEEPPVFAVQILETILKRDDEKLANSIYGYLKDWLNPLDQIVPCYVYSEILKRIQESSMSASDKLKEKAKK